MDGKEYQLTDCILQRWPFFLVDRITEITEESVQTKRCVTAGDYLSQSALYLVENMAQSAAALISYRNRDTLCKNMVLAGIEEARCQRAVQQGECICTQVQLLIAVGNLAKVSCQVYLDGGQELIASARLILYAEIEGHTVPNWSAHRQ